MKVEFIGFDRQEQRQIERLLASEPIEDDLLEDYSPVVEKISPGVAKLKVKTTGPGKRIEPYTIHLPVYLKNADLVAMIRMQLEHPDLRK